MFLSVTKMLLVHLFSTDRTCREARKSSSRGGTPRNPVSAHLRTKVTECAAASGLMWSLEIWSCPYILYGPLVYQCSCRTGGWVYPGSLSSVVTELQLPCARISETLKAWQLSALGYLRPSVFKARQLSALGHLFSCLSSLFHPWLPLLT